MVKFLLLYGQVPSTALKPSEANSEKQIPRNKSFLLPSYYFLSLSEAGGYISFFSLADYLFYCVFLLFSDCTPPLLSLRK